ncbi:MAG: hypothetical protein U9Q81_11965 [Pseudomonadota bacterium]|nr:hypothetical protein [Pseudomonadota bacterium]
MNERTIWRYWLVTDVFLVTGLLLWPPALFLAMAVTLIHSTHFLVRSPQITAFPMQVRIGYLGLLILGQAPFFGWVNWVQLAGTTALLTTGYCPLARILSLMPWNRTPAMSWKLFTTAIFTPPVDGSIVQVVSPD